MNYEWDKGKAIANYKKHGVYFSDAVTVFSDCCAITIEDDSHNEQRFVIIGMDGLGRVLVVVYTWREDDIRIISARTATPKESKRYEAR